MWEESPVGDWTLEVVNDGRQRVDLKDWSISFYGTKDDPQPGSNEVPKVPIAPVVPIEVDLNQVPKAPEQTAADVSKPIQNFVSKPLNEPQTSPELVKLEHCMDATNPNWCSVCETGYVLFNGRCVDTCPADGYYVGKDNHQDSCIQCYYSCKTCDGPNDYQVKSRSKEKLEV